MLQNHFVKLKLIQSSNNQYNIYIVCQDQSNASNISLHTRLIQGDSVWESTINGSHKPFLLDCSPEAYLEILRQEFSGEEKKFSYEFNNGVLSIIEMDQDIALRFDTIVFTKVLNNAVAMDKIIDNSINNIYQMNEEIIKLKQECYKMTNALKEQRKLLETAITSKQQVENNMFQAFILVLNEKKEHCKLISKQLEEYKKRKSSYSVDTTTCKQEGIQSQETISNTRAVQAYASLPIESCVYTAEKVIEELLSSKEVAEDKLQENGSVKVEKKESISRIETIEDKSDDLVIINPPYESKGKKRKESIESSNSNSDSSFNDLL